MQPAADTRSEYSGLFDIYWPIGVAVFVIVAVAVVVVVLRYRSDEDEFPADRGPTVGERKNMPLEGGYALLLAGIVAALLYFTFDTMAELDSADERAATAEVASASADAPSIDVIAARWSWRFSYEDGPTVQGEDAAPPTLVVPSETPVRFRITSRDVIHSFWIPHVRFKRDAFPGRTTAFVLRFDSDDEGFHRQWGQCAEFCGLLHSEMSFDVEVLPAAEFERWLSESAEGI